MNCYNTGNYRHGQFRIQSAERPVRAVPVRTITSESLFHGDQEISIDHRGAIYRLKITRQGKLILNK